MTDSRSELMALADCPIGLFYSMDGELCLKTEYGGNNGRIDAYIASSGEFFWGGAKTPGEQRQVFVRPVDLDEANSRLAASQPDREIVLWQWRCRGLGGPWSDWAVIEYSIEQWREAFQGQIERGTVECLGYLHTCHHRHGTDWEGRNFAIQALEKLTKSRSPQP